MPPKIPDEKLELLREWLTAKPDLLEEELIARYEQETGILVSQPTMSRALARLGFTRKKKRSSRRKGTGQA